jgi:hypothetical protein
MEERRGILMVVREEGGRDRCVRGERVRER